MSLSPTSLMLRDFMLNFASNAGKAFLMSGLWRKKYLRWVGGLAGGSMLGVLVGCSSYGVIVNEQKQINRPEANNYSILSESHVADENIIWLSFSGGGTRAAALAYGVLQELRDSPTAANTTRSRLDEIDLISSVSGGSFVAAYYGLYGDRIFEDFEQKFLRKNIGPHLIRAMFFNPLQWFRRTGRTEQAVKFYDKYLFNGATFSDLNKEKGPALLINATDLGYGVRFSFIQEYFDLLNSDIASFPLSRAVAASSAVPVLFDPIVVMNYQRVKEGSDKNGWMGRMRTLTHKGNNPRLQMVTGGISSYFDKRGHKFVHFVDGGITDNLGLRAIREVVDMGGGIKKIYERKGEVPPRRFVLISVNASTQKEPTMDATNKLPSLSDTMQSVTALQLRYYTTATLNMMDRTMKTWAAELSTLDDPIEAYFIQVRFDDVPDLDERAFLNEIPTNFSLESDEADALIKAGRELLRGHPEFQRFIQE